MSSFGTYNVTDGAFKRELEQKTKKRKPPSKKSVKKALKKASK